MMGKNLCFFWSWAKIIDLNFFFAAIDVQNEIFVSATFKQFLDECF